jgi:hypothetical protein
MSTRPVRAIRPLAKYLEDASGFVLSPTAPAAAPSPASTKSTMLTPMLMPTLTDLDVSSSPPASALAKRPRARPLVLTINEDADATDQDNAPKLKKSKKSTSQPTVTALQNEATIINIDNIDDMKNERLNKSKLTADIKRFFIAMPSLPGQDKVRMLCKLCE